VVPLVVLCLVLLWLRPQVVVGAPEPGLALLFPLALATRLGWFVHADGLRVRLQGTYLPHLAAAGTGAGKGRCEFFPQSLPRPNGSLEPTKPRSARWPGMISGRHLAGTIQTVVDPVSGVRWRVVKLTAPSASSAARLGGLVLIGGLV
jgi:hypothetical protein